MQIGVGGGDQAHVDADGFGRAHSFEGAGLQDTQKLGLGAFIELTELVKKECATVGDFEATGAGFVGTGIRALLNAEEF